MAVNIKTVGVIGAGQMGNGIAHVCALAGYSVMMNDVTADRIKDGLATINGNMTRQVARKAISEDERKAALALIKPAEKYDDLWRCDLVIESATEKEEVKRQIFSDLCAGLKPDAIIATNTSSISITRLASSTDRPERFIGIHFMNPVPLMELVEVIRGIATDEATFETCKTFVSKLGKTIAVSEDFPAFIVNRILLPMINEAIYTLYEGVGNVEAIDTAMRLGAHHPDGPARARRLHRARHLPVGHAGAARGAGRQQIPAVPAAGEIRRGRLARPQDAARLLRLPRRKAGADALSRLAPAHSRASGNPDPRIAAVVICCPGSPLAQGRAVENSALSQRRLDQLDRIVARPIGGAGDGADLAALGIEQQRGRHAEGAADFLES